MAKTSPRVSFGLFGLEIKADSTPAATGLQAWSKILDLKTDNVQPVPFATYEPDFWQLSGAYKFLPTDTSAVHVGLMTTSMSDGSGNFAVPPTLTVTFSSVHSSDGLVLRFSQATGDYANSITVAYYDSGDALICTNNYNPASTEFVTSTAVNYFKKIIITFNSTSHAYRYLRVTGIDFGQLIYFEAASIKGASLVEQVNMLSTEIPVNNCDLKLFSNDGTFSIVNPAGYYSRLSQRQPISVYEMVDSAPVFMGRYYLDTWKNTSDTEIELSGIDLMGVLDRIPYRGGVWTGAGIACQTLLASILDAISVPYDIDTNLNGIAVIGWIPQCSYREALQHIAFAVGAYVDCSRSNQIKIYQTVIAQSAVGGIGVTKAQKGSSQSLELKTLVTGVAVTAHNYNTGGASTSLFNGSLAAGTFEIAFTDPMYNLAATGATITESGVNYAILYVGTPGTVTLTGNAYIDTTQVFSQYTAGLGTTVTQNIIKVTDATLVGPGNGAAVVARMYSYYQQRYLQKVKLYASMLEPGQVALVDTMFNSQVRGVVERMSTDLFSGMVSNAEIVGVVA